MTLALELPAGSQSVDMMATPFAIYAAQPFAPRPAPQVVQATLHLSTQGGRFCFSPNAYTPALHNAMSRTEFDEILKQLNEVCKLHAPNVKAAIIPFLGGSMLAQKLNRLRGEISSACVSISRENQKRGLVLRLVDLDDDSQHGLSDQRRRKAGAPRFRVDLEVTNRW